MTNDTSSVTLISHPNKSFEGARDLYTAKDGWLLVTTRKPLFAAATRLLEENYDRDTMVIIRDNMDSVPPIAGRIRDLLA
jgi:hypothetical protein